MKFKIIYQISEIEREIYEFHLHDEYIVFTGIYYSARNDEDDVWGDEWDSYYNDAKEKEYEILDREFDETDLNDFIYESKINNISHRYNPCANKTIHGKTYYHGDYFAGNSESKDRPKPKISEEEIRNNIAMQLKTMVENAKIML
jgi:hypothetical protein